MESDHSTSALPSGIIPGLPITALAPMQDVTTLPFMQLIDHYGSPDYFVTEYFRVHIHSNLESHILESITQNKTGRPVFAQIIGESIPHIENAMHQLLQYPIAGIDLNMGCPAPKVYKKNAGGGLLKNLKKIDSLLAHMRASTDGLFTVKTRLGFDNKDHFEALIEILNKHHVNMVSIHGRTVKQLYRGEVDYDAIKWAVAHLDCPVIANGNIDSAHKAQEVLSHTGAAGVMIGRSAIRNPWIFQQCRQLFQNQSIYQPKLKDVREYIDRLFEALAKPEIPELNHLGKMKKFLNFVGLGVDPEGSFLKAIRHSKTYDSFFKVCDEHLLHHGNESTPFALTPHEDLVARPNHEI